MMYLRKGSHGGEFDEHIVLVLPDVEGLRRQQLVLAAEHLGLQDVLLPRRQRVPLRTHY